MVDRDRERQLTRERVRRYRERRSGSVTESEGGSNRISMASMSSKVSPSLSYFQLKGRLFCMAFYEAWGRFHYSERFAREFRNAKFLENWRSDYENDSSDLDFHIVAERRDGLILDVPVELKDWTVPQRLDQERFLVKVAKKFARTGFFDAFLEGRVKLDSADPELVAKHQELVNSMRRLFSPRRLVKLVIATPAFQFTERGYDTAMAWGFRIERVGRDLPIPVPDSQATFQRGEVPQSVFDAIKAEVVDDMVGILERVFYENS